MKNAGFTLATEAEGADVIFLNTCAIRDNAGTLTSLPSLQHCLTYWLFILEKKIWARLRELKGQRKRRAKSSPMVVGVLGCMAERLKTKLIEAPLRFEAEDLA